MKLKKVIPYSMIQFYRTCKRLCYRIGKGSSDPEEVFTDIYTKGKWKTSDDEGFCSGGGTTDSRISGAYLKMMEKQASEEGFKNLTMVDLGCGDMRIGSKLVTMFHSYVGVDVVKPLIENHQREYAGRNTKFVHLDMVAGELPDGDVCCIREVLQHLSNEQIKKILPKLKKYKIVYITEHLPFDNPKLFKNKDKPTGDDIRLFENSGVYVCDSPFNLSVNKVEEVLRVEGHKNPNYKEEWVTGNIVTLKYLPNNY